MINELTPQQKALIPVIRDKWLDLAFYKNKEGIDKIKYEQGVNWLYNFIGKKKPKILYCQSWIEAVITIIVLKETKNSNIGQNVWENIGENITQNVRKNIGENIRQNIGQNVWENIWGNITQNVRKNIGENIRQNVWENVRQNVWQNVRGNIGENIGENIRQNVWENVRQNIGGNVREIFSEFSPYVNWSDYGWGAFYDYFTEIGVLNNRDFNSFKQLLEGNSFQNSFYEELAIAIQPAVKIHRNASGRLHNTSEYAYEFSDGTGGYFINGRNIPDDVFKRAKTITRDDFISEPNSDYKGAWYEILGQQKVMNLLGASMVDERKIVHKNGDIETVSLWKTKDTFAEIDHHPFAWVKMVCPSTGTQYLQGVEPHHTCALKAIASLSPFRPEDYSFDLRS